MLKNLPSNKRGKHSIQSSSLFNRLDKDTQRQVSYKTRRLERKMNNIGWVDYVLRAYYKIKKSNALSMDSITRYGIPKQATYYVECHDQIKDYLKQNNNKITKQVEPIYNMIRARNTEKLYTKMERYNLRMPSTIMKEEPKKYNGERIHIKLEEVL